MCNLKHKIFAALLSMTMIIPLFPAEVIASDEVSGTVIEKTLTPADISVAKEAANEGDTTPAQPAVTYTLKKIKGKWYCISSATGKKVKGFRTIGNNTYYFNKKTGVMTKGWKKIGKKKYYFSKSGVMAKGWRKIKKKTYYFADNGVMAKGWKTIEGHKYYFNKKSGKMTKGWKKIGKHKYYFTSSGVMVTGWKKIKKKWYYFYSNGHMVKSKTLVIDGVKYRFKKNGACTRKPVIKNPTNNPGNGGNNGGNNGGSEKTPSKGYAMVEFRFSVTMRDKDANGNYIKHRFYKNIKCVTTNYHSKSTGDYHVCEEGIVLKIVKSEVGSNIRNYSASKVKVVKFLN